MRPAAQVQSLNPWTTREAPVFRYFFLYLCPKVNFIMLSMWVLSNFLLNVFQNTFYFVLNYSINDAGTISCPYGKRIKLDSHLPHKQKSTADKLKKYVWKVKL